MSPSQPVVMSASEYRSFESAIIGYIPGTTTAEVIFAGERNKYEGKALEKSEKTITARGSTIQFLLKKLKRPRRE